MKTTTDTTTVRTTKQRVQKTITRIDPACTGPEFDLEVKAFAQTDLATGGFVVLELAGGMVTISLTARDAIGLADLLVDAAEFSKTRS